MCNSNSSPGDADADATGLQSHLQNTGLARLYLPLGTSNALGSKILWEHKQLIEANGGFPFILKISTKEGREKRSY